MLASTVYPTSSTMTTPTSLLGVTIKLHPVLRSQDVTGVALPSRKRGGGGRRIVFSKRVKEGRWLTGNWLVVAYLWCDDAHYEWLRNLDVGVGDLVTPESTVE